jgi:hypothetical protein
MEGLKRQIRYQIMDTKKAFFIFWGIVLCLNMAAYFLVGAVNISLGTSMVESRADSFGNMVTTHYANVSSGNIIPIAIFILVSCMVMYYECFPTAIGFSSTRKNFYLGAIAQNIILCFSMAVVEGILLKLDRSILKATGRQPYDKILMFNLDRDNVIYVIIVLFLIFLLVCSIFNLLGAVLYKFGYKFWLVSGAIMVIILNLGIEVMMPKNIVNMLFAFNGLAGFFIKIILQAAVMYSIGWVLIRRRDVRSGK